MKRTLALAALLALSVPALASAKTLEFDVDPTHSLVGFKARHLLSRVPGDFGDFQGKVWLDPENVGGTLKLEATIQTASIDTRNDKRNGHLRSADFFDAEHYPTITFQSKTVKAIDKDTFEVGGDLTMRGVTKPVTLHVEWLGVITGFAGTPNTALDVTGTVNRKDWGVNWSKTLDNGGVVVADEVEIDVHIEANVPKSE
jgi:polyisoprenoid-binding protein YceI